MQNDKPKLFTQTIKCELRKKSYLNFDLQFEIGIRNVLSACEFIVKRVSTVAVLRASGRGVTTLPRRALRGRRQAGRARGDARCRHMLHTGVAARLHHTDHRRRSEHGAEDWLLAEER